MRTALAASTFAAIAVASACGGGSAVRAARPPCPVPETGSARLPPVEAPADALVLYEQMAVDDPDRTGNWRFLVRRDGSFFSARNRRLFVAETDLVRPDPALFWNVPFPATPRRRLSAEAVRDLQNAVEAADLSALARSLRSAPDERLVVVERWTAAVEGQRCTVVVPNRETPPELVDLRTTVDRLVAGADD